MNALKIARSIAFVIISIVAFTFSSKIDDMNNGDYVSSSRYVGDAYTGIQNASAETGCNVYKGNQLLRKGLKYTFILIGLSFLAIGITPTIQSQKGENKEIKTIPNTEA